MVPLYSINERFIPRNVRIFVNIFALVDVGIHTDDSAEKFVDDSLLEIWVLKFGQHIEAVFWSFCYAKFLL